MQRWIAATDQDAELESQILRIMTSRDGSALATLMHIAHANRASLGTRWWRLLHLALLWSGLSLLSPRFDDDPATGVLWMRWVRWLRSRKLSGVNSTAKEIGPLAIACRVERLEEERWKRTQAGRRRANRSSRGRQHAGLDTHALEQIFSWLLHETSLAGEDGDRLFVEALWKFETWRRYEDHEEDGDGDHAPPSKLGYALLQKLAKLLMSAPPTKGADIWKPVLSLGANAHYSIGHFITCWFLDASHQQNAAVIGQHWRAMLEYALASPN